MRDRLLWIVLAGMGIGLLVLTTDTDGRILGLADGQFADLVHVGAVLFVLGSLFVLSGRMRMTQGLRHAAIWLAAFFVLVAIYAFAPEFEAVKNRVVAVLMPGRVVELSATGERPQYMSVRGRDGHFHLRGEIDGRPVSLMVDTGASVVAMDRRAAESIGIETGRLDYSDRVMTANGVTRAAPVFLDTVQVGDITRHGVRAAVTEGEGLGTVLLGMSFLDTLTSYDFRGDRLILTD